MPSVADLLAALAWRVDSGKAAGWDVSGLQLGDPRAEVSRIGVCHEVTEEVVERSVGLDLLLTYHPLLFRPVTTLVAGPSPSGRAYRLVRAGTSLVVAHTAFDAAPGGTADALAEVMGLEGAHGFGPLVPADQVKIVTFVPPDHSHVVAAAMAQAGAGSIGNYSACSFRTEGVGSFLPEAGSQPFVGRAGEMSAEPEVRLEMVAPRGREAEVVRSLVAAHPYEEPAYDVYDVRANMGFVGRVGAVSEVALSELARTAADRLSSPAVRASGEAERRVTRVAVVPGSGGSLVAAAAAAGAEVVVTGDVSHHTAVEALDRGLAVIDAGHAATERPGVARLAGLVGELAEETGCEAVDLTDCDPVPWR